MTERQIIKKIDTALEKLRRGELKEMLSILLELKHRLEEELKRKEETKDYGDKLRHLMGWYKSLWDDKPPESFKFLKPDEIVGRHLKELLHIYQRNGQDIEELKRDYEEFKRTWKTGDRGILHFRSVLSTLKQKHGERWVSEEYRRGLDYYTGGDEDE